MKPNAYIIAGPNGAGKTTFAREFLPNYADCRNFINADLIAQGLAPFAPVSAAFKAGRLVLEETHAMIQAKVDFGFETTLSGRSHLSLFRQLNRAGYEINLFYLWVPAIDLLLARIRNRVILGGHDVPEEDVRRRFGRSISNFFQTYRNLADRWMLFDSSASPPLLLASRDRDHFQISHPSPYNQLIERYVK